VVLLRLKQDQKCESLDWVTVHLLLGSLPPNSFSATASRLFHPEIRESLPTQTVHYQHP
jgi:hypothetical protein